MRGNRRAFFAAALSLVCPGWGHLYAGAPARALAALALSVALIPCVTLVWFGLVDSTTAALVWGLWTGIEILAIPIDSARTAWRVKPPNTRPWQRLALQMIWVPVVATFLLSESDWVHERFVRPFQIAMQSMTPTLLPGDTFFVDVRAKARAALDLGDVVVFRLEDRPRDNYVKRVVGLPGQVVEIRNGVLIVDGEPRTEPVEDASDSRFRRESIGGQPYWVEVGSRGELTDFAPAVVPPGHVFVMGDSRYRSNDSRSFGSIPRETIHGRVVRLFWSWDRQANRVRWERLGRRFPGLGG